MIHASIYFFLFLLLLCTKYCKKKTQKVCSAVQSPAGCQCTIDKPAISSFSLADTGEGFGWVLIWPSSINKISYIKKKNLLFFHTLTSPNITVALTEHFPSMHHCDGWSRMSRTCFLWRVAAAIPACICTGHCRYLLQWLHLQTSFRSGGTNPSLICVCVCVCEFPEFQHCSSKSHK